MSGNTKRGKDMASSKEHSSINPKTGNPSLNSEIHATTAINSSVKPEDYPKEDREQQVRAATGRPPKPGR